MVLAADRFRELRRIWKCKELSVEVKIRIYAAGVASVLVYGCECWDMSQAAKTVGAWNARRLACITNREIREEYKAPSYDLVGAVRARRLKYVGKILRMEEGRLLLRAMEEEWSLETTGNKGLLYDTPIVDTFNELIVLAHDEELWRGLVESIYKRKPKRSRQDRRSELISTL